MTDIYAMAKNEMKPCDIEHWQYNLYLRKNPVSTALVKRFDQREGVSEIVDDIDGDVWYVVGYEYLPYWNSPARFQQAAGVVC